MTVYSHPPSENNNGTELVKHSENVAERMCRFIVEENKSLVESVGLFHDIGKTTEYFQDYILKDIKPSPNNRKNHSLFGAVTAVASLEKTNTIDCDNSDILSAFIAIKAHHGGLPNVPEYLNGVWEVPDNYKEISEQLNDQYESIVSEPELEEVADQLLPEDVSINSLSSIYTPGFIKRLYKQLSRYTVDYPQILKIYGSLTFADKTCVAGLDSVHLGNKRLSTEFIDEYVSSELSPPDPSGLPYETPSKSLDAYREKARKEIYENAVDIDPSEPGLYTIQLPTGFGKTISSLGAAAEIYEKKDRGNIIYSLPLTSIIDQTANVIEDIFDITSSDPEFTVHHHLSDTTSDLVDPTDKNSDRIDGFDINTLHAETWQSDITLTTFVQLFESLSGPKNKQSMKLAGIQNSVIVIDEIQSLPIKWWSIVTQLIETLVDEYNCHVISITATHPEIYERTLSKNRDIGLTPTELIDPNPYYDFLSENNRVDFLFHPSAQPYISQSTPAPTNSTKLTEEVINIPMDSIAVISNTIESAMNITKSIDEKRSPISVNKFLQDNFEEISTSSKPAEYLINNTERSDYLLHITSRLRPSDREILIDIISGLTETEFDETTKLYVSATQVFEAGVDVSFDCIYRDLAPASSLVQTAGRCNRSYSGETGKVVLYHMEGSRGSSTPAELIYRDNLNQLKYLSALSNDPTRKHTESEIINEGVENYYRVMFASEESKEGLLIGDTSLVEAYDSAKSEYLRMNSIIDMSESIDLIIPPTDDLIDKLQSDLTELPLEELMEKYKEYIVSLPKYRLENTEGLGNIREDFISLDEFTSLEDGIENNILFCVQSNTSIYTDKGVDLANVTDSSNAYIL